MYSRTSMALIAAACATFISATAVSAANLVSYVGSTAGTDSGEPCIITSPCQSLQTAINNTKAGGEVRILESGSYGKNVNVGKSITISGNGNTVFVNNPITINDAEATVTLRGIVLNGRNGASHGINISNAATVHIEHCVVQGFPTFGILVDTSNVRLFVTDTVARDNGKSGLYVVGNASVRATVDNSRFENNGWDGLTFRQVRLAAVTRTVTSGNGIHGLYSWLSHVTATSTTAANNAASGYVSDNASNIVLESSEANGNTNGLVVHATAEARISNSTFAHNTTGIVNGGLVETRGNNTVRRNGANTAGTAPTGIGGI